ncbi:TM2 domain-containing protein [Candidatus Saccharibacteria bacterium]|nr:MAG: TM2 domain-containing protein [Candidatus Saccharibacteria bacterium]
MFAPEPPVATTVTGINHEKSYVKTLIFSAMFGYFGVDRFYLGKIGTGVLKIVTFGGLGIWVLVDFIITLVGGAREKGKESLELEDTGKYKPFFIRLTLVWVGIYIAIIVLELLLVFIWMPKLMKQLTPEQNRYELVCYDHWNQNYLPPETCPDYMPGDYSDSGITNIYREN